MSDVDVGFIQLGPKPPFSNEAAANFVMREGIAYAVCDYTHGPFEDEETQLLWTAAREALLALENKLDPWLDDVY